MHAAELRSEETHDFTKTAVNGEQFATSVAEASAGADTGSTIFPQQNKGKKEQLQKRSSYTINIQN